MTNTPSVIAGDQQGQEPVDTDDEWSVLGEWYDGGESGHRHNGFRIDHIEDGLASLVLVRAAKEHQVGKVKYTRGSVTITWNKRGRDEPQYLRDRWETWIYSAGAARMRKLWGEP